MAGMFLAALDQSIVGTALPTHRQRARRPRQAVLGRHRLPADLDRRHPALGQDLRPLRPPAIFQAAIVHLPGRFGAVPASSQNMTELIAFRALQGIGGGGLMSLALRHHRRRHPAARARPLPGLLRRRVRRLQRGRPAARRLVHRRPGLALDLLHQPAGRHRRPGHHVARPKLPTSAASTRSTTWARRDRRPRSPALLLYLNWAGPDYGWALRHGAGLLVAAVVLAVLFVLVEQRAAEPIIPLRLFRNADLHASATSSASWPASPCSAAIIFLPLYLQAVKGMSPTQSGLAHAAGGDRDLLRRRSSSGQLITPHRPLQDLSRSRRGHPGRGAAAAVAARRRHAVLAGRALRCSSSAPASA